MVWKIPVHHPVTKGSYISLGAKFNGITFTSIVSGILYMDVVMLLTEAVLLRSYFQQRIFTLLHNLQ